MAPPSLTTQTVLRISTGAMGIPAALPELLREARNFLNYGDEYYRSLDLLCET